MAVTRSTPKRIALCRQGVAILLVLAMIILIVPVAVGLSQRAVLVHLEQRISVQDRVAGSIRAQLEAGPLQSWLLEESGRVVLDLEAKTPRVEVLHEQWSLDGQVYDVRITAWDQCGMVPLGTFTARSPLRAAVPGAIIERLDQSAHAAPRGEPAGLDQLGVHSNQLVVGHAGRRSAFPSPDEEDVLSVGAWIATHPVGVSGSINVNTAPLPLIEAAMSSAGRGGIQAIISARREGQRAPLPASGRADNRGSTSSHAPRLVGASGSWALRIDVHVGAVQRSWWCVFQQTSGRWECVQRLVIPD